MEERLRDVSIGMVIGLLTILFGIGWAFYIVIGHDSIHKNFEEKLLRIETKFIIGESQSPYDLSVGVAHAHSKEEPKKEEMDGHTGMGAKEKPEKEGHDKGVSITVHDSPIMDIAHERLTRGHIHAMGLGTLTIVLSLVLAFLNAPSRVKTIASILTAIGGFFYPFNWIVMGYRTPSLGIDAAEATVKMSAGASVVLIVIGILITGYYIVKMMVKKG